jgi:anti-sigma regulatory factor (Ser/Thr protein kinase)
LHSNSAEVSATAEAMAEWATASGLPAKAVNIIGVVVDELMANCVRHAYGGRADGRIEVAAAYDGAVIAVTVRDYGPAFDPTAVPPAETSLDVDQRDFGGLGIHLVRRFADTLTYRRDGDANEVVFTKAAAADAGRDVAG